MLENKKCVAVTGASGHIGTALVPRLLARNVNVRILGRSKPQWQAAEFVSYDLNHPLSDGALAGIDAVIHLAAETHKGGFSDEKIETSAVTRLLDAAGKAGARLVFISSQTARPDAPTDYGRTKWLCEELVLAKGGIVVRPGQVYGGSEKGLFGTLCRLARALPVLPAFRPDPLIQLIHVDDLAEALTHCAIREDLPQRAYNIGDPRPIGFSEFLKRLAEERFGRRALGLPIPIKFLVFLLRLPFAPVALSSQGERLHSLNQLKVMPTDDSLEVLGMTLRTLKDGLARPGHRRRDLVAEAVTLLRYVLREHPSPSCIKFYVRAAERSYGGRALTFRPSLRRWPAFLSLLDQPPARRRRAELEFWNRVDLATLVAESFPEHASRFLAFEGRWRFPRLARLMGLLAVEGVQRFIELIAGRHLDRFRPCPHETQVL